MVENTAIEHRLAECHYPPSPFAEMLFNAATCPTSGLALSREVGKKLEPAPGGWSVLPTDELGLPLLVAALLFRRRRATSPED